MFRASLGAPVVARFRRKRAFVPPLGPTKGGQVTFRSDTGTGPLFGSDEEAPARFWTNWEGFVLGGRRGRLSKFFEIEN